MTNSARTGPFGAAVYEEVQLPHSPLVRVLTQVRFPRLSALATGNELALQIAGDLSNAYPIYDESRELEITITEERINQAPGAKTMWRLKSADEKWTVTFADNFFALETTAYAGREDFTFRFKDAWSRFDAAVNPPSVQRVGVRYTNRITNSSILRDLKTMVDPGILGGSAESLQHAQLVHSMGETLYQLDGNSGLLSRWGILPPNAVLDPTLPPAEERCWVLDIDSFSDRRHESAAQALFEEIAQLAQQSYQYFRWVTNDRFLETFGGEVL